jgi:SPP1 gp7 family putative phage head morphogenesis protein
MIKELPVFHETISDLEEIEKKIVDLLTKEFYAPLLKIFKQEETIENSIEDLAHAIKTGKIYFYRGEFKGKLNAKLSIELKRLGAKWDRKHGSFRLPFNKLPIEIKTAIDTSASMFTKMSDKLEKKLSTILPEEIAEKLRIDALFSSVVYKIDKSIEKNLENIGVKVEFSDKDRKKITAEYITQTEKHIKGFLETEVEKLREKVTERARTGQRSEGLIQDIQERYEVGVSRARFIARQETKLATVKIKESRYLDAGITGYKWRAVVGSKDHPVRHRHKELSEMSDRGKIFKWDSPPNTAEKNQAPRYNNPGEDYNCRCTAVPVINFTEALSKQLEK